MFRSSKRSGATSPRSMLVMGVLQDPLEEEIWVWDLLARVRPQLCELIATTDTSMDCPDFDKVMVRSFRLDRIAAGRERVVLVAGAPASERHSEIVRWHAGPAQACPVVPPREWAAPFSAPGLTAIHQSLPRTPRTGTQILPVWLDDELPLEGVDFIHLPRPRVAPSHPGTGLRSSGAAGLAAAAADADAHEWASPQAASLRLTASALLGTLWEIVREVHARGVGAARVA